MLTYYITDRTQFAGGEAERRSQLLQTIRLAAAAGVDYIQLREKALAVRELESLAREALRVIRGEGQTRLLVNHRTDVALAVGADGVHLTGDDIAASDARALAAGHHPGRDFLVAVSCHSAEDVRLAEAHGADFAVLAPIFEKSRAVDGATETAAVQTKAVQKGIGLEEFLPWAASIASAPHCALQPEPPASRQSGPFSSAPISRSWCAHYTSCERNLFARMISIICGL